MLLVHKHDRLVTIGVSARHWRFPRFIGSWALLNMRVSGRKSRILRLRANVRLTVAAPRVKAFPAAALARAAAVFVGRRRVASLGRVLLSFAYPHVEQRQRQARPSVRQRAERARARLV